MYSAPARYQVRGAMINICLKQGGGNAPSFQGELFSDYRQKHYEALTERASLLYSGNKFSADFLYDQFIIFKIKIQCQRDLWNSQMLCHLRSNLCRIAVCCLFSTQDQVKFYIILLLQHPDSL